jgi:urea transport system permease protein
MNHATSIALALLLAASGVRAADEAALRTGLLGLAGETPAARQEAMLKLAKSGDARVEYTLNQFRLESLYVWSNTVVACERFDDSPNGRTGALLDALTGQPLSAAGGAPLVVAETDTKKIPAGRADRKYALTAQSLIVLSSPDLAKRLAAIRRCGTPPPQADALPFLAEIATNDPVRAARDAARESIALIHLAQSESAATQKIAAAETLGRLHSAHALPLLREQLAVTNQPAAQLAAYRSSINRIESYQGWVRTFDSLKFGISTGSVLVLMALGLSITFGMMGVINMAHGELMAIGAYATYSMQLLFGHTPDDPSNWYFVAALPVSFLAAAAVGAAMEALVVRHLYRRPLESLLATYGVSLILIQLIRVLFGDNRACNSPTWLVGNFELMRDMSLSYNRVFIFALSLACLPALHLMMNRTRAGLHMRATMQIRPMAGSLGVNTRSVDRATFMLGSGLAGVAGCALTTIGGITPDMGQNYIVDSFLVVVTGGVGQLAGVVSSGLGIGMLTKLLEGTFFGAVWAKILVLGAIIAFIQYKPSGLFAPKGRLADE